jgi:hypothetical protein
MSRKANIFGELAIATASDYLKKGEYNTYEYDELAFRGYPTVKITTMRYWPTPGKSYRIGIQCSSIFGWSRNEAADLLMQFMYEKNIPFVWSYDARIPEWNDLLCGAKIQLPVLKCGGGKSVHSGISLKEFIADFFYNNAVREKILCVIKNDHSTSSKMIKRLLQSSDPIKAASWLMEKCAYEKSKEAYVMRKILRGRNPIEDALTIIEASRMNNNVCHEQHGERM